MPLLSQKWLEMDQVRTNLSKHDPGQHGVGSPIRSNVRAGSKAEVLSLQSEVSFGSNSGHCSTRPIVTDVGSGMRWTRQRWARDDTH
jgi:hypothetical protein